MRQQFQFFEKLFKLKEKQTSLRQEVIGGLTTFMTMSYILFINPAILAKAGLPFEATLTATALSSALATLLMALLSNYPFAMACGMGLNAVLTYNVVLGMNLSWQVGMGIIVMEGLIVTLLVVTNLRELVMNAIPLPLKRAIGIGIGLFIAFIGLKDAGFVVNHPVTFVTFGNFKEPAVWVAATGLILTAIFLAKKISGALLLGMLLTAGLAYLFSIIPAPEKIFATPKLPETFFQFDFKGTLQFSLIPVIFSFFMVDFFDTMGTVIAVGGQGKFLDEKGRLPRLKNVLLADSLGAILGGIFSSSSVTTYIESAAGVAQGARTGLASMVVAICLFLAPFLSPLIAEIGAGIQVGGRHLNPVTAPALILVGFLMMRAVKEIDWENVEESFPAFLTSLAMPLTFSISQGMGMGFISYTLIKVLQGKAGEVPILLYFVSLLFGLSFLVG